MIIMADDASKAKLREQLDANLRRVYEEALNEEVPDKFKALLDQLREKGSKGTRQ